MSAVAVIAHKGKSLDGGLPELRKALAARGVTDPQWREVEKSREAPKEVQRALKDGAKLLVVWGGDGMVQRCIDALAKSKVGLAIVPAGTANLLAKNLGIPHDIAGAVEIGLGGERRKFDVGHMNGERFAVMAGLGFDARVIRDADKQMKHVLGRMAYVWAATKNLRMDPFEARVDVDGGKFYRGPATCVLFGNVGRAFGGLEIFDDAKADDGLLEVGVADADGIRQWGRTIARSTFSETSKSPFVHMTKARTIDVTLQRKVRYELDGSERTKQKVFRIEVEPAGVTICVPAGKA
jgi:YegS/Rv2252/BmrU family lipid kinase